jgi:hypothetical protein
MSRRLTWSFLNEQHEPQPYQSQASSSHQPFSSSATNPNTTKPTPNFSAFSRHSLHEPAVDPTTYESTAQCTNEDDHYMPTYTAEGERENIREGMTIEEQEFHDKWIHRDKLAEIESKELEEIGLRLGLPLRLAGAGSVRDPRDAITDDERDGDENRNYSGLRLDTNDLHNDSSDNDLPMPSYGQSSHARNFSGGRSTKSRIPVSKSSPLARTAPYHPSPSGQASWRNSLNSPSSPLNPSHETSISALPPPRSSTTSPLMHTRKALGTSQPLVAKSRQTSSTLRQTSTSHRRIPSNPTSSNRASWINTSSSPNRPITPSQRKPSGDAPWLATMFRPDPLLPPDQQMLPTHAKKLAMERGERVLTNEELLELEIEEARRAEGGFAPVANGVGGLDPALEVNVEEKELKQKASRISSRPSIRKLFSRNSVNSAKDLQRQSQSQLPTQSTITEYSSQQYQPQNLNYTQQTIGAPQAGSMQFVQNLHREQHLTPQQSFHSQAQSQRLRVQEAEEQWPLPSPRRQESQRQSPRMPGEMFEKDLEAGDQGGDGVGRGAGLGIAGTGNVSDKPIVTRVPEKLERNREEQKRKKEGGGCGCCVVM